MECLAPSTSKDVFSSTEETFHWVQLIDVSFTSDTAAPQEIPHRHVAHTRRGAEDAAAHPPTVCLSLYAPPLLVQGHPWYILLELLRVVQAFHMVSYNVLYIVVKSSVCGAYWSVVAGKFGSDSDSLSRMNKIVFNCSFQPTAALRRVWLTMLCCRWY